MKSLKKDFFNNNRIGLHIGPVKSQRDVDYKLVCPFMRSKIAMLITAVIGVVFAVIGYSTLLDAIQSWQRADDLSDLVGALFVTFWLIGWSVGVIGPAIILIVMMFGRQVLLIHSGIVEFVLGMPGLGFCIRASASEVTAVSLVEHDDKTFFPDEGLQIKLESSLGDTNTPFGSNMTALDVSQIESAIERNKRLPNNLDALSKGFDQTQNVNFEPLLNTSIGELNQAREPVTLTSNSTLFLIVANLVPILGVFFFAWDLGSTMVLYWAETAIILLFSVLKGIVKNKLIGVFAGVFSIAHAGCFMAIHFLFIWTIFVQQAFGDGSQYDQSTATVFAYLLALWPALLALLVSHAYSLKVNFFDRRDWQEKNAQEPFYSRIIMMQVTIIIGGGLALIFDEGILALCVLIVMKIAADVSAHLKHHAQAQ